MPELLLTGASSFTGVWFAEELARRGWRVLAPLLRPARDYTGLRGRRVDRLRAVAEVVYACPFGSERFIELVRTGPAIDVFAHHASVVTDHGSWDFDDVGAFVANTRRGRDVLAAFAARSTGVMVLTGTLFEAHEGAPSGSALACNPYGLSKTLTSEAFRHWCAWAGVRYGKFVAGTPFGPLEEPRFLAYLFQSWLKGETPTVLTPEYIRDYLPVSRMAIAYADFVERLVLERGDGLCRPSGYVASNAWFAKKVAEEAASRLGRPCPLALAVQTDHTQPYSRVNTEAMISHGKWDETAFWDAYVGYYRAERLQG